MSLSRKIKESYKPAFDEKPTQPNTNNATTRSSKLDSREATAKLSSLLVTKKLARSHLKSDYQTDDNTINIKIINDVIYNEKSHIVAQFKDFLITDNQTEFLKRFYCVDETFQRLPKIFEFYESYSKIFPNYVILSESRYMYKNIQRKQKMIDKLQQMNNIELNESNLQDEPVFNTQIHESIMNITNTTKNDHDSSKISLQMKKQEKFNIHDLLNNHLVDNSICEIENLIDKIKLTSEDKKLYSNFQTISLDENDKPKKKTKSKICFTSGLIPGNKIVTKINQTGRKNSSASKKLNLKESTVKDKLTNNFVKVLQTKTTGELLTDRMNRNNKQKILSTQKYKPKFEWPNCLTESKY